MGRINDKRASPNPNETIGKRWVTYLWPDRYISFAPDLVLERSHNPYRRAAVTLLFGRSGEFELDAGESSVIHTRAVLIGPNVERRRIVARGSNLMVVNFPPPSHEYVSLLPQLRKSPIQQLDPTIFEPLNEMLDRAANAKLKCSQFEEHIMKQLVHVICDNESELRPLDPRITSALKLISELPLNQARLSVLAGRVHLSRSRLQHLFRSELGCTIGQYARWVALWRVISRWSQKKSLTKLAHEAGFFDLAHLDHAMIEAFGLSFSASIDPEKVVLIRHFGRVEDSEK